MVYAFRTASTAGNASGSGLTVTKPSGTADGDLLVALAYLESDTNTWSSVGAGFTALTAFTNTGTFKMQMWWKIAASEPASWTWTPNTSGWRTVCVAAYTGATGSGAGRVDVQGTAAQADGTNVNLNAPGVTTTVNHDLLVAAFGNFQGNAWAFTSGPASAERADFGGVGIYDAVDRATGATGNTVLNAGTVDYCAQHVAFFLDLAGAATKAPPPPFRPQRTTYRTRRF